MTALLLPRACMRLSLAELTVPQSLEVSLAGVTLHVVTIWSW